MKQRIRQGKGNLLVMTSIKTYP